VAVGPLVVPLQVGHEESEMSRGYVMTTREA
jgi:hypothetical protein